MRAVLVVAVVLGLAGTAFAQPGMTPPQPIPQPEPMPAPQPVGDQLSENTALLLSIGGTVVPWAVMLGASDNNEGGLVTLGALGTFFGPSIGHWYAHDALTRGMGLRALGVGAMFAGILTVLSSEDCDIDTNCGGNEVAPAVLIIGGVGLYVAGTVDDIATAPKAVREYNNRQLMVVPVANAHGGGFAIAGRF
ncbi:MAG TPA: hypothetical protein VFQ53_41275 [Kofleriaceae bacterium]|nr:hypothetical protein [Kofleriaceae bacterium]